MGSNKIWKSLAVYTQIGSQIVCKSTCATKNTVSLHFFKEKKMVIKIEKITRVPMKLKAEYKIILLELHLSQ